MKLVNPNSDTLALPDRKSGSVGSRRGQLVGGCGHGAWPRLQRASATYLVGAPCALRPGARAAGGSAVGVLLRCPGKWLCSCHRFTRRRASGPASVRGRDPALRRGAALQLVGAPGAPASWPCGSVGPSGAPAGAAQLSLGALPGSPVLTATQACSQPLRLSVDSDTLQRDRSFGLDSVLRGLVTHAQFPSLRAWGHHSCCRPAPHRATPVSSEGQAPPCRVSQLLPSVAGPCAVLRGGKGPRGLCPLARGAHPAPGPGSLASGVWRLPDVDAVAGKPSVWPWLLVPLPRCRP